MNKNECARNRTTGKIFAANEGYSDKGNPAVATTPAEETTSLTPTQMEHIVRQLNDGLFVHRPDK